MKKRKAGSQNPFQIGFAFLLVAGLGYVGYLAVSVAFDAFSKIDKQVAAAIIAAFAAVIVSVMSVVLTKSYERRKQIEFDLREKKILAYNELIDFFFKILNSEINTSDTVALNKNFMEIAKKLMIWGSDEIVKKFSRYRQDAANFLLFEEVLFSIRKDLGHKNKDLVPKDIFRLFLNDIDAYIEKQSQKLT